MAYIFFHSIFRNARLHTHQHYLTCISIYAFEQTQKKKKTSTLDIHIYCLPMNPIFCSSYSLFLAVALCLSNLSTNQIHHLLLFDHIDIMRFLAAPARPPNHSGWFNSFTGVVKRRFAKYVKSHLASGDKEPDAVDQPKFYRLPFLDKYRAEKAAAASSATPPTASTTTILAPGNGSYIQAPSLHVLSGIDRRHRSPDPPPRFNRGQSPLLLRRNLLDQASGSPILPRR